MLGDRGRMSDVRPDKNLSLLSVRTHVYRVEHDERVCGDKDCQSFGAFPDNDVASSCAFLTENLCLRTNDDMDAIPFPPLLNPD